jgi:hypothetical protein
MYVALGNDRSTPLPGRLKTNFVGSSKENSEFELEACLLLLVCILVIPYKNTKKPSGGRTSAFVHLPL